MKKLISKLGNNIKSRRWQQQKESSEIEKRTGLLLITATLISLYLANSEWANYYLHLWETPIGIHGFGKNFTLTLHQWVNDGLMTIFFLVVGLEIKQEIIEGELSNKRKARIPILAALGGMLVPALLYRLINNNTIYEMGWGIPMATDIAFAIGILSLLGKRIPTSMKIFLMTLAIVDDLGSILVIALYYTNDLSFYYLGISMAIIILMLIMNKIKISNYSFYLVLGIVLWYYMMKSGIHATLSGVITALVLPTDSYFMKQKEVEVLNHQFHKFSNYLIMPLFALANTAIQLVSETGEISSIGTCTIGIMVGLIIGKPLGIILFSLLPIKLKYGELPEGMEVKHLIGVGMLGGIGFTMSIFIASLAFSDPAIQTTAKIAILSGSILSALIGFTWIAATNKKKETEKK